MNLLKDEKSPYLLQHADNPVDWYPWGNEAFEKAKREDKPILLSIGYSTCHWCHVMAHESFEDLEVARLMNETFISIKVDREERPDVDNVYMTVCQMLSKGACGWPLNVMMTPDKKPFFAATYIPKESRYGRAGMIELVPRIGEVWKKQREELLKSADSITTAVKKATDVSQITSGKSLRSSTLTVGYNQLHERFDEKNGGFASAPKFPTAHNYLFLLRYWNRTGDEEALKMVEKTLQKMRLGGVYDHVGFGFHRYSTDSSWLLPHFEKMLYDQAMLSMTYVEAYQATGKKEYETTAREIFAYVLRDLTSLEGAFYSAEDADSEGQEGKFYIWSEEEIKGVLGDEKADLIIRTYNVEKSGNFTEETTQEKIGFNILHLRESLFATAKSFEPNEEEFLDKIEESRKKLLESREKRIRPYKDDKILTDWNGLMIAALSKGGSVLNEPQYTQAAKRAAGFILKEMRQDNGRLLHRYRGKEAGIKANADDYAFLVWGLLELYEATFDVQYLTYAIELQEDMIELFWDDKNGGFYFTPHDAEELIARQKEIYDGAVPSGNSVALLNLIKIGGITGKSHYEEKSAKLVSAFAETIETAPMAYTQLLTGLDFAMGPSYEVVIVGDPHGMDTETMLTALRKEYNPNKVILFLGANGEPDVAKVAEFTKGHTTIQGKATAYVCQNHICKLPTTEVNKMLESLNS